jgi:hypothetical protein
VIAGAGRVAAAPDVLTTEALACSKALLSAMDYGISRIQLEVDFSILKQAISSLSMDLAASGMLISDVRNLLHEHFVCKDVLLIPRYCNATAHGLAKLGLSWDPGVSYVWTNPPPSLCKRFDVSRLRRVDE